MALSALFVVLCYQYEWRFLLSLTADSILHLSRIMGIPMDRVSFDTLSSGGTQFTITIACTFVDVFAGAVPLIWRLRKG